MSLTLFEGALGGIGLFLLGMRIMSDGMRTVADARIRSAFFTVTSNRVYSIACGGVLSLLLSSPSSAIIFSLGLLNGGILSFFQILNVFAGIMLGAALSLYLPVAPYAFVATPLIFIGVMLRFFARRRRWANAGNLLLGAGLLFFGLTLLEASFRPSFNHPFYGVFHGIFFQRPVPALFLGSVIACFVQSSASLFNAVHGLTIDHHLGQAMAAVMMMGGLLGIPVMACLASLAGIAVSRRAALVMFGLTLCGVIPLLLVTPLIQNRISALAPLTGMHVLASVIIAFLTTTLSGVISRSVGRMQKNGVVCVASQPCAGYLDIRILNTPTLAIEQARKEIARMLAVTTFMYADVRELLFEFDARRVETIRQHEQVLDSLNHEISAFLSRLAHTTQNSEVGLLIPGLLQTVADLEHIGDACEEILERIVERKEEHVFFTEDAMGDLKRLASRVGTCVARLEEHFAGNPVPSGEGLRKIKSDSRAAFDAIRQSHYERICSGACSPRTAMLFNELCAAFIRIAELSWNIAAVRERNNR